MISMGFVLFNTAIVIIATIAFTALHGYYKRTWRKLLLSEEPLEYSKLD